MLKTTSTENEITDKLISLNNLIYYACEEVYRKTSPKDKNKGKTLLKNKEIGILKKKAKKISNFIHKLQHTNLLDEWDVDTIRTMVEKVDTTPPVWNTRWSKIQEL
jgi:hypothetical protein